MFKSVQDYDDTVFKILDNIRNEKKDWYKTDNLSQEDFNDILEFIVDNGLAKEKHSPKEVNGFRSVASNPRITRLGLIFIEQWRNYKNSQLSTHPDHLEVIDDIKKYRNERGLKQSELAKLLGKTANVITNWENGLTRPDIDSLEKMLEILGLDANALMGKKGQETSDSTTLEQTFIKKFRALDERGKQAVGKILEHEYQYSSSQNTDLTTNKDEKS